MNHEPHESRDYSLPVIDWPSPEQDSNGIFADKLAEMS